mmetsp:Transcript_37998/g.59264  ORF Transcript_37998/g.59264 Transcript_37998/m.59264 type:complete len:346 (+) Transcript_37998:44-1081(+)
MKDSHGLMVDTNGDRRQALYRTSSESSLSSQNGDGLQHVHLEPREWPVLQIMIFICSLLGMLLIWTETHDPESMSVFERDELEAVARNLAPGFGFFFLSDIVAQCVPHSDPSYDRPSLQWRRALRAGLLGILINGFGYTLWLHRLNLLIAPDRVNLHGTTLAVVLHLLLKAVVDSFVWGAFSNTVGIIGRRVFEGDALQHAIDVWSEKFLGVMQKEFFFWPLWNAVNFCLVPRDLQVGFTSLGALVWNAYLSWVASSAPVVPKSPLRNPIKSPFTPFGKHRSRRESKMHHILESPLTSPKEPEASHPPPLALNPGTPPPARIIPFGERTLSSGEQILPPIGEQNA